MDPAKAKHESHTRSVLVLAAFIFGTVVGGLAIHFMYRGPEKSPQVPERPIKDTSHMVTALGRIEPEGGVLVLGIPTPDRLLEIYPEVKEEALVKKGQELVKLESYLARELNLKLSQRQLADARDKLKGITIKGQAQIALDQLHLAQLDESGPFDLSLQRQKIEVLALQADNAKKNLERAEGLASTLSHQEIEQQKLAALQAESELKGARLALKKLIATQKLQKKAAQEQLAASKAGLDSAQKEVPIRSLESQKELAALRLREAILRSPSKGKILKILARPGELVGGQQAILQMADTSQMMVMAEVYETDILKVHKGNQAFITGRVLEKIKIKEEVEAEIKKEIEKGLTGKVVWKGWIVEVNNKGEIKPKGLTGKVVRIGAIIGKNRVVDVDPTARVDRRVAEVRIRLDESAPVAGLINNEVMVELNTESPEPK